MSAQGSSVAAAGNRVGEHVQRGGREFANLLLATVVFRKDGLATKGGPSTRPEAIAESVVSSTTAVSSPESGALCTISRSSESPPPERVKA